MPEIKRRKRCKLKIIICLIAVIFILLLSAALWLVGFDNIKSVYYGFKYDEQQIDKLRDENSLLLEEKVKEFSYISVREPTEQEMSALNSGEITYEQLSRIISEGLTLEQFRENSYDFSVEVRTEPEPQNNDTYVEPQKDEPFVQDTKQEELDAECDAHVSQIVAKMYILRSSFTSALSGLAKQAYADYKNGESKSEIVSKYIGQAAGLESQCDGNVDSLMAELKDVLVKYGRTTELVDTIYTTYNNEKQYAKAHYMGLYLNN